MSPYQGWNGSMLVYWYLDPQARTAASPLPQDAQRRMYNSGSPTQGYDHSFHSRGDAREL